MPAKRKDSTLCVGGHGIVPLGPDPSGPGGHKCGLAAPEAPLLPQQGGAEPLGCDIS